MFMRRLPSPFRLAVVLFLICCLFSAVPALAGPINAKSAILMDVTTGRILYEQRADMKIPPASLTKVISMYVAMNAISARKADYNNTVKVSARAARTGGSRFGLRAGKSLLSTSCSTAWPWLRATMPVLPWPSMWRVPPRLSCPA